MSRSIRNNYESVTGSIIKMCSKCKKHLKKEGRSYCRSCLNESTYKYRGRYKGNYVYFVIDKVIDEVIKIGETKNIYIRNNSHLSTNKKTEVSRYITANNRSKEDIELYVLDLTKAFREMNWGKDERKTLEAVMIENYISSNPYHKLQGTNKKILSDYERNVVIEDIYRVVDVNKFEKYSSWFEAKSKKK